MKIALHACCGPCLLEPYDDLSAIAEEIAVVYTNSNIHPVAEYERRRDTLLAHAQDNGIRVVELPYDPAEWLVAAGRHGSDRAQRCRACYELRLSRAAEWAGGDGFDAITTTLTVSPYQDQEAINEVGREVASRFGLEWVARDFRTRYPEATRRSRELEMYRQNYCGCLMSELEARAEREARKAARRAKG